MKKLIDYLLKVHNYLFGKRVRIGASTFCQLKCPGCQEWIAAQKIGRGNLSFAQFKKFVDTYPDFNRIELSSKGEIFLNPELEDILRYAHQKKVRLQAVGGVNLNSISDSLAEALVRYKCTTIVVSIDGATNETYSIYRQGGNLGKVLANIDKINYYKKLYNSKYPSLVWKFILFDHSKHELHGARRLARKYNMRFISAPCIPTGTDIRDNNANSLARKYMPRFKKYRYCAQLWIDPQINWDGEFLGCCTNINYSFGNVFTSDLDECIKSEKYQYTKKMVCGEVPVRKDSPCCNCSAFREMQVTGDFININKRILEYIVAGILMQVGVRFDDS
jgi:hypothetical protein